MPRRPRAGCQPRVPSHASRRCGPRGRAARRRRSRRDGGVRAGGGRGITHRRTPLSGEHGVEIIDLGEGGGIPTKTRIRAAGQVIVRLDDDGEAPAIRAPDDALFDALDAAEGVLVSDYGRGVTASPALRHALADAAGPLVWDPHPRGAPPIAGVRLLTPNADEARRMCGGLGTPHEHAATLRREWGAAAAAVTLGARGAVLADGSEPPLTIPASPCEGGDVCGAGDRLAASGRRRPRGRPFVRRRDDHRRRGRHGHDRRGRRRRHARARIPATGRRGRNACGDGTRPRRRGGRHRRLLRPPARGPCLDARGGARSRRPPRGAE